MELVSLLLYFKCARVPFDRAHVITLVFPCLPYSKPHILKTGLLENRGYISYVQVYNLVQDCVRKKGPNVCFFKLSNLVTFFKV